MVALPDGVETLVLYAIPATAALRSEMTFPTVLAVEGTLFLNKTHVYQWTGTVGRGTLEVVRAVKL